VKKNTTNTHQIFIQSEDRWEWWWVGEGLLDQEQIAAGRKNYLKQRIREFSEKQDVSSDGLVYEGRRAHLDKRKSMPLTEGGRCCR